MKRIAVVILAFCVLGAGSVAEAQPVAKVQRVGVLAVLEPDSPLLNRFREGLRELGYAEGQNVQLDIASVVTNYDELADALRRLVARKPDVILTYGGTALQVASKAAGKIPIVMVAGVDPVETGLVDSLGHPGGNITGVSTIVQELLGKRLELLLQTVPGIKRIGILLNPASKTEGFSLRTTVAAARTLGVEAESVEVPTVQALEQRFPLLEAKKIQALIAVPSTMLSSNRRMVVALANRSRLPAIYVERQFVDVGGLMAYGPNFGDLFRLAATYVARVLRGAKASDLPIERPTQFELVINLKTAKSLGLTIPPPVLLRAAQVIE